MDNRLLEKGEDAQFTGQYGKATPSEIGKKIGGIVARERMNLDAGDKMKALEVKVDDGKQLAEIEMKHDGNAAPSIKEIEEYIKQRPVGKYKYDFPKGLVLNMYFDKSKNLDLDDIIEYMNRICAGIGLQLDPDKIIDAGTIPHGAKSYNPKEYTYYMYSIDDMEASGENKGNTLVKSFKGVDSIPKVFDELKKNDSDLQSADASVIVGKKDDISIYFMGKDSNLGKLDGSAKYLFIIILGDQMDAEGAAKLATDVAEGAGAEGATVSPGDVVEVGQVRKKNPSSGQREEYDVFAVKL